MVSSQLKKHSTSFAHLSSVTYLTKMMLIVGRRRSFVLILYILPSLFRKFACSPRFLNIVYRIGGTTERISSRGCVSVSNSIVIEVNGRNANNILTLLFPTAISWWTPLTGFTNCESYDRIHTHKTVVKNVYWKPLENMHCSKMAEVGK